MHCYFYIYYKCEIILYADDTLIFTEGINNEWLKMNKLKLNENKTKLMQININNELVFKINNQVIETVNQINYLGFIIDKKLILNELQSPKQGNEINIKIINTHQ